jgi:hypothetical protein
MGPEMPRQSQLNRPIQVVGNAVQQGLLDLLLVAASRDCAVKPALDDRDARLNSPPLAIDVAGKGQLPLAAIGTRGHATRWPSRNRGNLQPRCGGVQTHGAGTAPRFQ